MVFPLDGNYTPGSYRSRFGPCFDHDGVILSGSNENLRYALRRLFCVREPEIPGFDYFLRVCQDSFIRKPHVLNTLLKHSLLYYSTFDDYTNPIEECIKHIHDPHPKRFLRELGLIEMQHKGTIGMTTSPWLEKMTAKVKLDEIARWDHARDQPKYARIVMDLKIPASLQGARVTELYKQAMSQNQLRYSGGVIHFCKSPEPDEMDYIFTQLHAPDERFFFVFFSDDACIARRIDNRVVWHNIDISSCDTSNGPSIFYLLMLMAPPIARSVIELLTEQCKCKFRVYSTQSKRMFVEFKPLFAFEPSGSTLTTLLNNIANLLIAIAIADVPDSEYLNPKRISDAVICAGYLISGTEPLPSFHHLQFLKNSPVFDTTGVIRSVLNFGVFLRTSGTCHGDLPGRGDYAMRATLYQNQLVSGMYPRARIEILHDKYDIVPVPEHIETMLKYKVLSGGETFTVETTEYLKKYNLTDHDIGVIDDTLRAGFMHFCAHEAVTKVLYMDYQLKTTTWQTFNTRFGVCNAAT